MKTWNCPKKQLARTETILSQTCLNQYWSMAGYCTPGGELDQILSTGFIQPEQFHGVEITKDIYDANRLAYPDVSWHHGDFLKVMQHADAFNPSLVNADLLQTIDTAAEYISSLLYLLTPFDSTLIANIIMKHRWYRTTIEHVLQKLTSCQQFRYALNEGWTHDNRCYLYPGTGTRSRTVMGTFIFQHLTN